MKAQEYEELFLVESREHVSAINQHLLALEQGTDDGDGLSAIFRAVHTIKGMSAAMGYASASELSHELETVLDTVRSGVRGVDPELLDVCFRSVDLLELSIDAAVAGRDGAVGTAWAVTRLRELAAAKPVQKSFGRFDPPPGEGIVVRVALEPNTPLRGVRAYLVVIAARALGTITAQVPSIEDLHLEQFDHEFVLRIATTAAEGEITRVIRGAGEIASVVIGEGNAAAPAAVTPLASDSAAQAIARTESDVEQHTSGVVASALPSTRRHVRIDLRRLDALMNLIGELVVARGRLQELTAAADDPEIGASVAETSRLILALRDEISASRLVPAGQVFERFPRLVRDLARALSKEVDLTIDGNDIELDRAMLDEIADSLVHLLKNAIDHGIESPEARRVAGKPPAGRLRLSASRERSAAVIRLTDDGRGIDRQRVIARAKTGGLVDATTTELTDEELLRILTQPGFSTAETVTDISGRGVGFDAVHSRVRGLGGAMDVRSIAGQGTAVTLRLPLSLAIIRAVLVRVGDETYAIPASHVTETVELIPGAIRVVEGRRLLMVRDTDVPLQSLRDLVGLEPARGSLGEDPDVAIILAFGDQRVALVVDDLIGQDEIVVKQFDPVRGGPSLFSGATLLSNGSPALIVDAINLV